MISSLDRIRVLPLPLLLCITISCKPETSLDYEVKKLYSYRIGVQSGGTQYYLQNKRRRFQQFAGKKAADNTAMFAYRITRQGSRFAPPPYQYDTVEVAVRPAQADHLFALTKVYFETFTLTDVDTVFHRPRRVETDDVAGRILLDVQGQFVTAQVGALHSSGLAQQTAAYFHVKESFAQLFPKSPLE